MNVFLVQIGKRRRPTPNEEMKEEEKRRFTPPPPPRRRPTNGRKNEKRTGERRPERTREDLIQLRPDLCFGDLGGKDDADADADNAFPEEEMENCLV